MEEEWKLFRKFTSFSRYHIPGDEYYVSNKGRYKFNDMILELGKGLYIDSKEELHSIVKLPHHKEIYRMFVGEIPEGHVLHHIDHDHTNNSLDNLVLLDELTHNILHWREGNIIQGYMDYEEVVNDKNNSMFSQYIKTPEYICNIHNKNHMLFSTYNNCDEWKIYLSNRVKKHLEEFNKNNKNELERKKEEKRKLKQLQEELKYKQKQLEIEEGLKTGKYKINPKTGKIYNAEVQEKMKAARTPETYKKVSATFKKMNRHLTEEQKEHLRQIMLGNKNAVGWKPTEEYRQHLREAWQRRKEREQI